MRLSIRYLPVTLSVGTSADSPNEPDEESEIKADDKPQHPIGSAEQTAIALSVVSLAITAAVLPIAAAVASAWAVVSILLFRFRGARESAGPFVALSVGAVTAIWILWPSDPDLLVPRFRHPPTEQFCIRLGTGISVYVTRSEGPFVIVSGGGQPLLWARVVDDALAISGRFFDADGVVAKITDGRAAAGHLLAIERRGRHTLIIRDRWDTKIAVVEYIDTNTIQVLGRFTYKSGPILTADGRGIAEEDRATGRRTEYANGVAFSGAMYATAHFKIGR